MDALQLTATNHTQIMTYGEHIMEIYLGLQRKFEWTFVIANIQTPLIGADFLSGFKLMVDLNRKQLIDFTTGITITGVSNNTIQHNITVISTKIVTEPAPLSRKAHKATSLLMQLNDTENTCALPTSIGDTTKLQPVRQVYHHI